MTPRSDSAPPRAPSSDPERAFWLALYRAVLAIAEAIKTYKLGGSA